MGIEKRHSIIQENKPFLRSLKIYASSSPDKSARWASYRTLTEKINEEGIKKSDCEILENEYI